MKGDTWCRKPGIAFLICKFYSTILKKRYKSAMIYYGIIFHRKEQLNGLE